MLEARETAEAFTPHCSVCGDTVDCVVAKEGVDINMWICCEDCAVEAGWPRKTEERDA